MGLPTPNHYWNFNETAGTVAADSAGGAMMVLDKDCRVPGKNGTAIRFNPRDGVRLATTNLAELAPPWTASFWVRRDADAESSTLFSSSSFAIKLEQWPNTHLMGITKFGAFDETYPYRPPLGDWIHLTLVGTIADTKLYANGKLQGTLSRSINLGLRWIGSSGGWTDLASMLLDEVKVFGVALTDAQVDELAGAATGAPKSQLFNFDTGKATRSRMDAAWVCGALFGVGATDITVTALGVEDDPSNGSAFADRGAEVGLWDAAGATLLASATVVSADPLGRDGVYRYHTLSAPVVLRANTGYLIGAVCGLGFEPFRDSVSGPPPVSSAGVTLRETRYTAGGTLKAPLVHDVAGPTGRYGPANALFY